MISALVRLLVAGVLFWGTPAAADNLPLLGVGGGGGIAQISLTQACTQTADLSGSTVTSLTASCSGIVSGHMLMIAVTWCYDFVCTVTSGNNISSVSSSLGNTCTAQAGTLTSGALLAAQLYKCPVTTGGSETLTVNFASTGSFFPIIDASEWSRDGTSENGGVNFNNGTVTTLSQSTTTSLANEFVYCFGMSNGTPSTAGSGQTQITAAAANNAAIDSYKRGTTAGSYSCTYTPGSGASMTVAALAIK